MSKLILIIEDNKTIAMYEQRTLLKAGYNVVVAHDIDEAKVLINTHKTNIMIAIVDINLPNTEEHALDFLLKKNIPSIAMTGSFHPKLRDEIIDKNIIDYIVLEDDKQLELLQATINRIISNEHRKILIVDDSKSSRFALNSLLKFQNFTILQARDGLSALEILKENPDISIALIDYEMPKMNGAELTRIIRQNYSRMELSIFAISVHSEPIITIEFLKAGANDFITKPYVKEEVLARLSVNIDMMNQHQMLQNEIKQRKEIEIELQKSKEEALNASLAKSNFLANMSHEVRTPMNAIIGFINILCKKETSEKKLQQLNIVKSAGESLMIIINDILDFSKIESGKINLEKHLFKTIDPFNLTMELFTKKAKEKNISMTIIVDENLPENAYSDSTRVQQIYSNLLSNAIKFSKENSTIETSVIYDESHNILKCKVKDYGIGIEEKSIDKIFNVFEQEDTSTTRKYGGTGLGLSISKSLCEIIGGSLYVTSTKGEGSIFSFEIDIFKDVTNQEVKENLESYNQLNNLNLIPNMHILLVEDNKSNQLLMNILLEELNLKVTIANDGLEAVSYYKDNEYDMILMDENMPNMNGVEATSNIRKLQLEHNRTHVPIIAVTANALKGDRKRFLSAGMDDYISKPIDQNQLKYTLVKHLSK